MAYRKPGVKVVQEFLAAAPALAAFTLPAVAFGKAYQVVSNELAGTYTGDEGAFALPGLLGGALLDTEESDSSDVVAITKRPVEVTLRSMKVLIVDGATGGAGSGAAFSNAATGAFADVLAGDSIVINTGAAAGTYRIKSKTDANTLVMASPFSAPAAAVTYSVVRSIDDAVIARDEALGFQIDENNQITIPADLSISVSGTPRVIDSAKVYVSYRALRTDLASEVTQFTGVTALTTTFGSGQIVPSNELAYALSIMLQNTVTPVHGLGLNEEGLTDEVLAYTAAAEVLTSTQMYALVPLTQNPVVHTLLSNHVTQMSDADKKRERVVIINSKLLTTALLKEESTTVATANNSRQIVSTRTDGHGAAAQATFLTAGTVDLFTDVNVGDTVVVVSGTGTTPGSYQVVNKIDANNLELSAAFVTSGTPANIGYYIYRADGLGNLGAQLYDRNGGFLTAGVAPGHYLTILTGPYAGRYKIATVPSDNELTVSPAVAGVTGHVNAVNYEIDKDLSKLAQAESIAGYSSGFANRRVVHMWPDILKAPVGQTLKNLPGYFGCAAVGGLTTGLPTQQGFTNLAISGFLGSEHGSRYFTEDQLDIIADGGTMLLAQDGANEPLYIRHQLTTDRSSIKFQEFSVTKNIDYAAKYIRAAYAPFIGQYNITDTTLDALRTVAEAILMFLIRDSKVPRFGGVVRNGKLVSIVESTDQIDTVIIRFQLDMPIPLNNLDIYVAV